MFGIFGGPAGLNPATMMPYTVAPLPKLPVYTEPKTSLFTPGSVQPYVPHSNTNYLNSLNSIKSTIAKLAPIVPNYIPVTTQPAAVNWGVPANTQFVPTKVPVIPIKPQVIPTTVGIKTAK